MPLPSWPELILFMVLVLLICTYIMAASGHFPREARGPQLSTRLGTAILWGTMILVSVTGILALVFAYLVIPWYAAVIGGGLMMLIAPFTLQPFSDRFVDGPSVLVLLALAALLIGASASRNFLPLPS